MSPLDSSSGGSRAGSRGEGWNLALRKEREECWTARAVAPVVAVAYAVAAVACAVAAVAAVACAVAAVAHAAGHAAHGGVEGRS